MTPKLVVRRTVSRDNMPAPSQVAMIGLSLALLTSLLPQLHSTTPPTDTPAFSIAIDGPVYVGQPVWIRAVNIPAEHLIRYPFYTSIGYMGCNRLEVKRNGVMLTPRNFSMTSYEGLVCGSSAPSGSPENRLPLHVLYPIHEPGTYSVRWTVTGRSTVPQESQWLTFEALQATAEQHEAWLKNLLAAKPQTDGQLAGDFLPSLLAAAPDSRALNTFIKYLYAGNHMVSGIADSALEAFPQSDVLRAAAESLEKNGPSNQLAFFATYHSGWTRHDEYKIVHAAIPHLQVGKSAFSAAEQSPPHVSDQTSAALTLLRFIFYIPNHAWPANHDLRDYADTRVLQAAPDIIANANASAVQELSEYLGAMENSHRAHELLLQIAERTDSAGAQARICLTWHPQLDDLSALAATLNTPGDRDVNGTDRATLPYALVRAYGDKAFPFLEQSVAIPLIFGFVSSQQSNWRSTTVLWVSNSS